MYAVSVQLALGYTIHTDFANKMRAFKSKFGSRKMKFREFFKLFNMAEV